LRFLGANYLIFSATKSKYNKKDKEKAHAINWLIELLE